MYLRPRSLLLPYPGILLLNLTVFWGITISLLVISIYINGQFVYTLDDTYIHLSLARYISESGMWGISPGQLNPASSSPLFTLFLTGCRFLFEQDLFNPLFINSIAGTGLIIYLHYYLTQQNIPPIYTCLLPLILSLSTLAPLMFLSGMEHLLHIWIALVFVASATHVLSNTKHSPVHMFIWGFVLCALRYEGLFLLGTVSLLLTFQKQIKSAMILGLSGTLPALGMGLYFLTQGGLFFPTSVLNKSKFPGFNMEGWRAWIEQIIENSYGHPFLLSLLGLLALLWIYRRYKMTHFSIPDYWILISGMGLVFHIVFAQTGYRYENYLIGIGIIALGLAWPPISKKIKQTTQHVRWGIYFGLALCMFPFLIRTTFFFMNHVQFTQNIFQQQVQMGLFLQTYYPISSVAANDCGSCKLLHPYTTYRFSRHNRSVYLSGFT